MELLNEIKLAPTIDLVRASPAAKIPSGADADTEMDSLSAYESVDAANSKDTVSVAHSMPDSKDEIRTILNDHTAKTRCHLENLLKTLGITIFEIMEIIEKVKFYKCCVFIIVIQSFCRK